MMLPHVILLTIRMQNAIETIHPHGRQDGLVPHLKGLWGYAIVKLVQSG